MRFIFFSIFILSTFANSNAQPIKFTFSYENFEKEIIAYEPKQNQVTDKNFEWGVFVLSETKKSVNNDSSDFNRADYLNILSSFLSLNESKKSINIAFEKFKNSEGSCKYFSSNYFKSNRFDLIRNEIEKQILLCQTSSTQGSTKIDLKQYSAKNNLDYILVKLIAKINKLDKKYRNEESSDFSKQTPIDLENQRIIDSLYHSHKKYIGISFVGEKFKSTMWAVIQHSNLDMMEKYLPIIQKAVSENELHLTTFKMLLDRIHGEKYNYQFFGSQGGIKMADEEKINKIKEKYGID